MKTPDAIKNGIASNVILSTPDTTLWAKISEGTVTPEKKKYTRLPIRTEMKTGIFINNATSIMITPTMIEFILSSPFLLVLH
jgi:hypothetical protein